MRFNTLLLVCLISSSQVAGAQGINLGDLISKHVLGQAAQKMSEALKQRMIISPDEVVVSQNSGEFVIVLSNPTKDTMVAEMLISTTPPPRFRKVESSVKTDNRPIPSFLADSDPQKPSPEVKAAGTYRPLARAWINNLPDSVLLSPGESKEITIHIDLPDDAVSGLYVAWISSAVEVKGSRTALDSRKDVNGGTVHIKEGVADEDRQAILSSAKIMFNLTKSKPSS